MHFGKFTGCDMEFEMTDDIFYGLHEHSNLENGDMFIERISPDSHKHEVSFALWLLIIDNPERVQLFLLGKTKNYDQRVELGTKLLYSKGLLTWSRCHRFLRKIC